MKNTNSIGRRIKDARTQRNLTLGDVAARIGVSRQTVQRYESGVIGNIPNDKIEALAAALGVSPGYLMGWEQDEPMTPSYYTNPETAALADEIKNNKNFQMLFDTTRKLSPEALQEVINFANYQMKKERPWENED